MFGRLVDPFGLLESTVATVSMHKQVEPSSLFISHSDLDGPTQSLGAVTSPLSAFQWTFGR